MSKRLNFFALPLAIWATSLLGYYQPTSAQDPDTSTKFFEEHIRPILVQHCIACHGPDKSESTLRLDLPDRFQTGGDSGPVIDEKQLEDSLLLQAVRHEGLEMPPNKKLSEQQILAIETWVRSGAPWPQYVKEITAGSDQDSISQADRDYWFFQPLSEPTIPASTFSNPIDAFVSDKLHSQGLNLGDRADDSTLVRRLYLDLVGVPPTFSELQAYLELPEVNSEGQPRYEQLVDKLLADTRYGQRWGRYWLDLVRFAESDGFKQDDFRPSAYRYRDYVVQALNDDIAYSQFITEQLAGDELDPNSDRMNAATGYLRHWIYEYNQRDVRSHWDNILNDVTDVTGEVFLGLGFSCARCHDHKFDPLLQKDYYRLQAFFAPMEPRYDIVAQSDSVALRQEAFDAWSQCAEPIRSELESLQQETRLQVIENAIEKFPPDVRPALRKSPSQRPPNERSIAVLAYLQIENELKGIDYSKKLKGDPLERWKVLKKQYDELKKGMPKEPEISLTVRDIGTEAPEVRIPGKPSAGPIEPAALSVLADRWPVAPKSPDTPNPSSSTGRRLALARWISDPSNPLAWRVIANRIWQHHFGRGLVSNASDFGRLGEPPTHPELLDFLALQFIEQGGRFKALHRSIVTSETYRQSSYPEQRSQGHAIDPENRLLWRYNPRRLDAEQIRDSILLVSGSLDDRIGGPSDAADSNRRSVYQRVMRNSPNTMLATFDAPDASVSIARRNTTTTSLQSLFLTNSPWMIRKSESYAKKLVAQHDSPRARIQTMFRESLLREPTEDEYRWISDLVEASSPSDPHGPWADACQALWNTSEFLYIE
jgi:mono/diheme cytochrome c family protein